MALQDNPQFQAMLGRRGVTADDPRVQQRIADRGVYRATGPPVNQAPVDPWEGKNVQQWTPVYSRSGGGTNYTSAAIQNPYATDAWKAADPQKGIDMAAKIEASALHSKEIIDDWVLNAEKLRPDTVFTPAYDLDFTIKPPVAPASVAPTPVAPTQNKGPMKFRSRKALSTTLK